MHENDVLADQFEASRNHLRAVAYRMLGSMSEADDAVQEAWLRVSRSGTSGVENLGGWLTTVVARVCLDLLRSRKSRREEPLGVHLQDAIANPEHEALLADSVGLALLVVLETLAPAERLAFVLHDRARQREIVDAFLAASRGGDFAALLVLLDPDVVLRADGAAVLSGASREVRGAAAVADTFSGRARFAQPALVNGAVGAVWAPGGRPSVVFSFTITRGKIVEIDIRAEPARLRQLDLAVLDD